MKPALALPIIVAAAILPGARATNVSAQNVTGVNVDSVVELSLLTQTEVAEKIRNGWTSVFIVTGGTEIRGPHAVIGVHNVLATQRALEAARRLGRTIVAPTIPFAVSATGGFSANQWTAFVENGGPTAPNPGAIQVDAGTFKGILEGAVRSVAYIGFEDIFLMGDHGGGQQEMREVASAMTEQLAPRGIRVHYVGDFYQKTHDDIDLYMYGHRLPIAGHGGMMETAEMMFREPAPYAYIRPNFRTVPFDGTRFEGPSLDADLRAWKEARDARESGAAGGGSGRQGQTARAGRGSGQRGSVAGGGRGGPANPDGSPRVNNGLTGNPHPATKEIGRDLAEIGIMNTVNQVRALLAQREK